MAQEKSWAGQGGRGRCQAGRPALTELPLPDPAARPGLDSAPPGRACLSVRIFRQVGSAPKAYANGHLPVYSVPSHTHLPVSFPICKMGLSPTAPLPNTLCGGLEVGVLLPWKAERAFCKHSPEGTHV